VTIDFTPDLPATPGDRRLAVAALRGELARVLTHVRNGLASLPIS
jgi:hypothetical protein